MNSISIEGQKRAEVGQKAANAARRQDLIPCVMYGGKENVHFTVNAKMLKAVVYTPNIYNVLITIDGKTHSTLMKDLQFHPVTEQLLHIDFLELTDNKKVIIDVPITLTGTSIGVRSGGKLLVKLRKATIKALPQYLMSELPIDISTLDLGKSLKVKDLSFPNIEILNNPANPIVTVEVTRALKSAETAKAKDTIK